MSISVTCANCGTRLDAEWIRSLRRGQALECPACGKSLMETGYVQVIADEHAVPEPEAAEAGSDERAA
jgi:DNA-directed RNA polymerase subunit RPC12/RpoP